MSIRVFSWDANPNVDAFLYRLSDNRGQEMESSSQAEFKLLADGKRVLQLLPPAHERYDSTRALIPFVRVLNKLKHPPSINYPIPACGAHTRPLYVSDVNFIPDDSALALS